LFVEGEFTGGDDVWCFPLLILIALGMLLLLLCKLRVSTTKLVVEDIGINVFFIEVLHVGFIGVTRISR